MAVMALVWRHTLLVASSASRVSKARDAVCGSRRESWRGRLTLGGIRRRFGVRR